MTKIVYQGIPGSYSYSAALIFAKKLKNYKLIQGYNSKEASHMLVSQQASIAVLAIRNSLGGEVVETKQALAENPKINLLETIDIQIDHCLGIHPKTNLKKINTISSHPQAIKQCSIFIKTGNFDVILSSDTASAAKKLIEKNSLNIGAICSLQAIKGYGLKLIEESIQDSPDNTTTFGVFELSNH